MKEADYVTCCDKTRLLVAFDIIKDIGCHVVTGEERAQILHLIDVAHSKTIEELGEVYDGD